MSTNPWLNTRYCKFDFDGCWIFCDLINILELCSGMQFSYWKQSDSFKSCFYLLGGLGALFSLGLFVLYYWSKNFPNTLLSPPWIISFSTIVVRTDTVTAPYEQQAPLPLIFQIVLSPTSGNFLTNVPLSILTGALYRSLKFSVQLFPFWNAI